MGMKPPANESQPTLPNVCSNPKDVGEFPPQQNLASSQKNVPATIAEMAPNVLGACGPGNAKKPG